MERCHESGAEVVALVPSRTDTEWWQLAAFRSAALVLWRGRFRFLSRGRKAHPAPFPSSVFYFGPHRGAFLSEFAADGYVAKGAHVLNLSEAA
jgi:hypothetical protein